MGDKLTPSWALGEARDRNPEWHNGGSQWNVPLVYRCYHKKFCERAEESEALAGLAVCQTLKWLTNRVNHKSQYNVLQLNTVSHMGGNKICMKYSTADL